MFTQREMGRDEKDRECLRLRPRYELPECYSVAWADGWEWDEVAGNVPNFDPLTVPDFPVVVNEKGLSGVIVKGVEELDAQNKLVSLSSDMVDHLAILSLRRRAVLRLDHNQPRMALLKK